LWFFSCKFPTRKMIHWQLALHIFFITMGTHDVFVWTLSKLGGEGEYISSQYYSYFLSMFCIFKFGMMFWMIFMCNV
jgi:hypothetical protein